MEQAEDQSVEKTHIYDPALFKDDFKHKGGLWKQLLSIFSWINFYQPTPLYGKCYNVDNDVKMTQIKDNS